MSSLNDEIMNENRNEIINENNTIINNNIENESTHNNNNYEINNEEKLNEDVKNKEEKIEIDEKEEENKLIYIEKESEVEKFELLKEECKKCKEREKWVAVDTEFNSRDCYYLELCIIQLAFPSSNYVYIIDASSLPSSSLWFLFEFMKDEEVIKVFHAARQDLLALSYYFTQSPRQHDFALPVFDTQIAMQFVEYLSSPPSYKSLISTYSQVELSKTATITTSNWKKRPLTEPQLEYAKDDVIYLRIVYPIIRQRLIQSQREHWFDLEQSFQFSSKKLEGRNGWKKVKGKGQIPLSFLPLFSSLAMWREQEAMQLNKPKQWLVRDPLLLYLSSRSPSDWPNLILPSHFDRLSIWDDQILKEKLLPLSSHFQSIFDSILSSSPSKLLSPLPPSHSHC